MRRVFPLRPAETSLLVTYDNSTFEQEDVDSFDPAPSSAAFNLKHRRRSSSTNFSASSSLPSSPRKLPPLRKCHPPPSSEYPEFAEVASPSPPSSLWTSSFFDDGDSTSFNSSDGTCSRRRPTSYFSSSSSSSINFNPADSGSSSAISGSKDVDDTASSSQKASSSHANTENAICKELKVNLRVKTHSLDEGLRAAKPSLKALAFGEPLELVQPETPTYVIPKEVEEYMQNCLDMPSNVATSHRSVLTPKAFDRTGKSSGSRVRLSRPARESPQCAAPKPPLQRNEAESCSCSTPFKYLSKCLKSDRRRPVTSKDDGGRQRSSTKFSTLTNGLYSPQLLPRAKLRLDKECVRQTDSAREDLADKSEECDDIPVKGASLSTPRSLTPGQTQLMVSNARSIFDENRQSPVKCQSFGSAMVNEYVRPLQDEAKLLSFHESPRSASFHYESDCNLSSQSRPQSGSVDLANRLVNLRQGANAGLSKMSGQGPKVSSANTSRWRPLSMDASMRLGRDSSICSSMADNENLFVDCKRSSDLFAAEEKNMRTLVLLQLEINKLCKEKRLLARELAVEMKARHCQQKSAENSVRHIEAKMEEKLIAVEKDHAYAQACLEQEMDRRKKEWSAKLDKIRVEEKRLRDRVTEMALERVELQKAIAFHKSRETSLQAQVMDHELSAQTWMRRHRQSEEEVACLRKSFTHACNKLGDKEHELNLVVQRSKALERENTELFKEAARLKKAYADQEMTFEELWQRLVDIVNGPSDFKVERLRRLHTELRMFAVREQALRYEIDVLHSQLLQTKQRALHSSEDGLIVLSNGRMCSPKKQLRFAKVSTGQSLETLEDLMGKLEVTKEHARQVEYQLEVKEEEMELLHSALKEREIVVNDLQGELSSVKSQRDGLRKQVQQMSQEAVRLTRDLTELRLVVEKLDDELMLKEGEISILRDTCSDGDFLE
ncbi:hypothetical protein GOP47_0025716 [Adiantum capillus-veneris]|uniref:Uncharacterized protein n=1 Tax=Adiantum capillus-veneris TaxID=13818 RepID=A0A9D4U1F4_ADICA|nr:hypothetical protein GOP47_0025716 [Adiantum capillus-veneris]